MREDEEPIYAEMESRTLLHAFYRATHALLERSSKDEHFENAVENYVRMNGLYQELTEVMDRIGLTLDVVKKRLYDSG